MINARVELDPPVLALLPSKSPKSSASPVDGIVMKSISLRLDGCAQPMNTPRVLDAPAPIPNLDTVKSPKSCASPKVEIVKKSITSV